MIAKFYSLHPYTLLALLWVASGIVGFVMASRYGRGCSGLVLGLLLGPFGVIAAVLARSGISRAEMRDLLALTIDRGQTGIVLRQSDPFSIVHAIEGSSAHQAGIRFGDRLIAINGVPCDGDYRKTVLKLAGKKGTTITVKIRRDSEVVKLTLSRD